MSQLVQLLFVKQIFGFLLTRGIQRRKMCERILLCSTNMIIRFNDYDLHRLIEGIKEKKKNKKNSNMHSDCSQPPIEKMLRCNNSETQGRPFWGGGQGEAAAPTPPLSLKI